MYEIENNMPRGSVHGPKKHKEMYDMFDQMQVEQSFVVDNMKKVISVRSYAKRFGKNISYRKIEQQKYRVWRVL